MEIWVIIIIIIIIISNSSSNGDSNNNKIIEVFVTCNCTLLAEIWVSIIMDNNIIIIVVFATCIGELLAQIWVKPWISEKKMVDSEKVSAVTTLFRFSWSATDLGNIWYNSVSVLRFSLFRALVLNSRTD